MGQVDTTPFNAGPSGGGGGAQQFGTMETDVSASTGAVLNDWVLSDGTQVVPETSGPFSLSGPGDTRMLYGGVGPVEPDRKFLINVSVTFRGGATTRVLWQAALNSDNAAAVSNRLTCGQFTVVNDWEACASADTIATLTDGDFFEWFFLQAAGSLGSYEATRTNMTFTEILE